MLDVTKPVRLRKGWPARIVCTDMNFNGEKRVLALVMMPGIDIEQMMTFDQGGGCWPGHGGPEHAPTELELVNS